MLNKVILVDENNNPLGVEEKLKAHKEGKLHRAFSILIFNSKGELLIQQRAKNKYHCPKLWSNTVCSHPIPKETYFQATHKRLKQEMGFDTKLIKLFSFIYKAKFSNGLIEYEHDTIFIGQYNKDPIPNLNEVMNCKWISMNKLRKDVIKNKDKYSIWFRIILEKLSYNSPIRLSHNNSKEN